MNKKQVKLDERAFRGELGGKAVTEVTPGGPMGTVGFGITWFPDETYEPVLRETAQMQGSTPQQVAADIMNWGIANGWTYNMVPEVTTVFLSRKSAEIIRQALGNPEIITGEAIASRLLESLSQLS